MFLGTLSLTTGQLKGVKLMQEVMVSSHAIAPISPTLQYLWLVLCETFILQNFTIKSTLQDICSRVGGCEEIDDTFNKVLSYISIIGVTISMVALVLTVITMLIFK